MSATIIGGLTWSDSIALAERAALLLYETHAHLALAMIDEAEILSVSIPTDGILSYFRQCRKIQRYIHW